MFQLNPLLLACFILGMAQTLGHGQTSTNATSYNFPILAIPTPSDTTVISKATTTRDIHDPFAVVAQDSLWQEKNGTATTRRVNDALSLTYETSTTSLDYGSAEPLSQGQKAGAQLHPYDGVTLTGDVHTSNNDGLAATSSSTMTGAGGRVETRLPMNSIFTMGINSDVTTPEVGGSAAETRSTSYDAQLKQPVGTLPLSAILKGHFDETTGNNSYSSIPSLEQSLVWKPVGDTTLQAGLRQQQYQSFPGITDALNEAVFADWSQPILPTVQWHSYAELLNSRSASPISPTTSGVNGTPQANAPGQNAGLGAALPLSMTDQSLTFSTGPSFQIEKDIQASVEYSNKLNENAAAAGAAQEQRVSISVKGSF